MAQNELDIIIKVQSDMKKQMDQNTKAVEDMQKKTEKSVNKMEDGFKNLGSAIQAAMGSAAIRAGSELIKNSEKQSLSLSILKTKSKDVYNQLLKTSEVTFGLANKFDMVSAANKALSFGIDLSNGRLETLMSMSAKTAAVMGTDVKSAFDDLITGVARESKMILDNLGVMVDLNEVYGNYADELGITTAELTKAQKQTALLDEVNRKLKESTKEVTNEMVEQGTRGTAALKELETAAVSFAGSTANAFVEFGKSLGVTIGIMVDESESFWDNWSTGVGGMIDSLDEMMGAEKEAEAEYKKYLKERKKENEDMEEFELQIMDNRIQMLRRTGASEIEIVKASELAKDKIQEQSMSMSYKKWKGYYDARLILERRYIADQKNIAKIEKDRAEEFGDDEVFIGGRVVSKSAAIAGLDRSAKTLEVILSSAKTKAVKKAKSKKAKLGEAMIFTQQDIKNLDDPTGEIAAAEKAAKEREVLIARYMVKSASKRISLIRKNAAERLAAAREADAAERREKEKHFGMMQRFGSDYLNAIVSGNAEKIPEILAQQAMMFGQELVWDGIKTLWMGTAKNALFPGLGASAVAVGTSEIAIGAGMMGAGALASSALSSGASSGTSSGDDGAYERNSSTSDQQDINIDVTTSLYGDEIQAKKRVKRLLR